MCEVLAFLVICLIVLYLGLVLLGTWFNWRWERHCRECERSVRDGNELRRKLGYDR
jgi:hypothetical protein